jgi:hypothetical protein
MNHFMRSPTTRYSMNFNKNTNASVTSFRASIKLPDEHEINSSVTKYIHRTSLAPTLQG